MSTRCQVQVIEGAGKHDHERVTLYHHCDGYPDGMIPVIHAAWHISDRGWQAGRAGKAASYLCASHPGQFEPESGHELHGDIDYYYRLRVGGAVWALEVYSRSSGFPEDGAPSTRDAVPLFDLYPLVRQCSTCGQTLQEDGKCPRLEYLIRRYGEE